MAEPSAQEGLTLPTSIGDFEIVEIVTYPNGGRSSFYQYASIALIVDDGICERVEGEPIFDYSLITSKQNEYVARNERVYRFLSEDLAQVDEYLDGARGEELPEPRRSTDRAEFADASPLEMEFEEHFFNVYGPDSVRYLWKEYGITDREGHVRYIDYLVNTRDGKLGVEENGVSYHHPQIIGRQRYRDQLLKQNSCQYAGIKLFRFSTEDCRFGSRLEDDILSFFGKDTEGFIDSGLLVGRDVELYEHQEGALGEMARKREQGTKCFLAVFPTASGKSRIVEEDIARFAPTRPNFRALIMAPNTAIVEDWKSRIGASLPSYVSRISVCTYGYINRHYAEYDPAYFNYIVVDEAHHSVAPALKRTIQYFDPDFLVGLTATDKRPDRKSLETVFGSYRVGLSLQEAMEKGIIARANAFRVETNVDLSEVRVNGKDYVNADLEKTLRVSSRNELIVDVLREYFCEGDVGKRQGVVFCVNVKHAEEMERLLNEVGILARAISGRSRNSQEIMGDFKDGKIRFLCSCQMISEGWDYPELGILVMARPTLSRVLYLQQLGRGLRRTSTKKNVFVIDVVDEYSAMVVPCSLHSIFQNPYYVPFGDILKRDYKPGEWVEVEGIRERIERITEVDVTTFAEKYEGFLSVEQVAREYFVSTDTVNGWIKRKRIEPTVSFPFGSRRLYLFSPDDVAEIRQRFGIPVHDDDTIRDDFFAFLEERDYSLSYKMPFLLSFLANMDPLTGGARIDDVLDDYIAFYVDRIERGLVVDRSTCPYNAETLKDRKLVKRSMLTNPFEKFERKRFLYYSKDLGVISMNHALQSRLSREDFIAIQEQMQTDLVDYYLKLE
ncbi:MAG: DEAD/DEAH box helicase family protein [Eggerthellaceae bacterium]|nr:DEAD/DEAH box helicase family protein [Eggerthellaceae bacterium]